MKSFRFKRSNNPCSNFFREMLSAFFRTKTSTHEYTKLSKVLDMFDVAMIGLGTTIGMGSYIFIGYYARDIGPAMIISHLLAAAVSFMNALCYAEFVSREPGSGGAYSQAYYMLGEFIAAIIGWLLAAENVVGSALSARGLSEVIDTIAGHRISDYVKSYYTFSNPILADYPDVAAVLIELIILTIVSFGLKEIAAFNNILVLINVSVLILIVLVSGSNIEFSNWTLPPKEGCGKGGFMPYGISSVCYGVHNMIYAYIGFDAAGHAGSEVPEPERTIPTSLLLSVMIATVLYLFQSFTYTLLWPYCDQDVTQPIQHAMKGIGMDIMRWVTTVGCPIGLIGNLICSTYPLTRLVYAISEDGLLYSCLAYLNIHTKTPIIALFMTGIITAAFALLFDKFRLAEVTCLGALGTYCLIAVCVLTLRYTEEDMEYGNTKRPIHRIIFNMEPSADRPTVISSLIVLICGSIIFVTAFPAQLIFIYGSDKLKSGDKFEVFLLLLIILFYVLIVLIIVNQPSSPGRLGLQVFLPPCFKPILPVLCILVNAHICASYSFHSWMIIFIWLAVVQFMALSMLKYENVA